MISNSPSICSIFTNDLNIETNILDYNDELINNYKNKLTENDRLILLEFLHYKIKYCPNKEVRKHINNSLKFVHKIPKLKENLNESFISFKEYVFNYKHKDRFNYYSKHFVKNLILLITNLSNDYVQAHRLYNYMLIKKLDNKQLINHNSISNSLPLGDNINIINFDVEIDNNKYINFGLSNYNEFYPNYFCNTCIITNSNKIRCSHIKFVTTFGIPNNVININKLENTLFDDGTPVHKSKTGIYGIKDYYITFFKDRYSHLLSKEVIDKIYDNYKQKIKADEDTVHNLVTNQLYKIIKNNIDIKEYKNIYDIIYKDYKKYWINVIKK